MEEIIMTASERRKSNRARLKKQHKDLRGALMVASATMDPGIKKIWLAALRSGEYKQGKGTMCKVDSKGEYSFCCLGVLADEAIDADWYLNVLSRIYGLGFEDGPTGGLRLGDMKMLGLTQTAQTALAKANDAGLRFSTIADAIEECL